MSLPFDAALSAEAFARPGGDTRQWFSFATVDRETPNQPSVRFTKEYGPLVSVTLQPSGVPVVARVAGSVAGNGEAEWFPFLEGDEVLVALGDGDERNCVIVGRMNQEIDQFPERVAGMDSTKNNFAFRRIRTPYVLETASSYLVRSSATGAFFGIDAQGSVTVSNGDSAFLALRADFLGMQSGDGAVLMQIDVSRSAVVLEGGGARLTVGATSTFYSAGTLELGTSGNQAAEHATSVEALAQVLTAFCMAVSAVGPVVFFAGTASQSTASAAVGLVLNAAALLNLDPVLTAAIVNALRATKTAGTVPGVGCPGLLVG